MPREALSLTEAKKRYPPMWVIYDHPTDYPDNVVVRLWYGEAPTMEVSVHSDVVGARAQCALNGASMPLSRGANDDPKIVETWI